MTAPPEARAQAERVLASAARLGLAATWMEPPHVPDGTIAIFLAHPFGGRRWSWDHARRAWVTVQPGGLARAFLYRRFDEEVPSLAIRPTAFDHDMRLVWRFLKWGRR